MSTAVMPKPDSEEMGLTVIPVQPLSVARAPELVLEEAMRAATALKRVIDGKKNKVQFRGETYLEFEDWQTLGRFYGVTARIREVKEVHYGEARGFEAFAEAVSVATGMIVSAADAICLNDEANWKSKPLAQIRSMAQTRACAKALRNVLAWVVVLAGYRPTPAEEMPDEPKTSRKPAAKVSDKAPVVTEQKAGYEVAILPQTDKATSEVDVKITSAVPQKAKNGSPYILVDFNVPYDKHRHVATCFKVDLFVAVQAAANAPHALLRFEREGKYLKIVDVLEDFSAPQAAVAATEIQDDEIPFLRA